MVGHDPWVNLSCSHRGHTPSPWGGVDVRGRGVPRQRIAGERLFNDDVMIIGDGDFNMM